MICFILSSVSLCACENPQVLRSPFLFSSAPREGKRIFWSGWRMGKVCLLSLKENLIL